jgi:hypothetical protein
MHGPQNIMFMDLVGPEREEVKGDWRWMHNKQLNYLYFSPFVKKDEIGRMYFTHEKKAKHPNFFLKTWRNKTA